MPADGGHAYKSRHADQRSSADADDAEMLALRFGSALVDDGTYDDLVAGAMEDFEPTPDGDVDVDFSVRDVAEDTATGRTQEMVDRRIALMGDDYPFSLETNRLTWGQSSSGLYEFLLAASWKTDISSKPFNAIPQVFERVVAALSVTLLGLGAKAVHVGHPRDDAVGKSFKEAVEHLHSLTNEWPWRPDEELPPDGPPSGDDGLDFVTWLAADGARDGRLFLLGQCACGDDWVGKLSDIDLDFVGQWTGQAWRVRPTKVFATPHVVADGHFVRAQKKAGIILDRVRLCSLASTERGAEAIAPFRENMAELTKLVIESAG